LNTSQGIFTKVILSRIEETLKLICGLVQFQEETVCMYQTFPIAQNGEIEGFCVMFFAEASSLKEMIKMRNNGKFLKQEKTDLALTVLLHHLHMY